MGRERTTGWLAVAVAVSAAAHSIWMTWWAGGEILWGPLVVGLVPAVAVAVAGLLLVRRTRAIRGVAAFLAVASLTEAAFLPAHVHFAVNVPTLLRNWWSLGTALAGLVLGVLALVLLRSIAPSPNDRPPVTPARVIAVVGGGLVSLSAAFAWLASAGAAEAGWTPTVFGGQALLDLSAVLRLGVLLAATLAVAAARTARAWQGGTLALLLAQGLAVGIWLDPTWQGADAVLAPGLWLALAGQALLAVALIVEAAGPSPRVPERMQAST